MKIHYFVKDVVSRLDENPENYNEPSTKKHKEKRLKTKTKTKIKPKSNIKTTTKNKKVK